VHLFRNAWSRLINHIKGSFEPTESSLHPSRSAHPFPVHSFQLLHFLQVIQSRSHIHFHQNATFIYCCHSCIPFGRRLCSNWYCLPQLKLIPLEADDPVYMNKRGEIIPAAKVARSQYLDFVKRNGMPGKRQIDESIPVKTNQDGRSQFILELI
jgi:hypothetical protein